MKKKKTFWILLALLVLLLVAAGILYTVLKDKFQPDNLVTYDPPQTNEDPPPSDTNNKQDTSTEQGNSDQSADNGQNTEQGATGSHPSPTAAPDFTVYDKDGNAVKLSDFRGKPVVLNFWASWCGPCQSEMPDFNEKHKELGDEIHFLMVNLTDSAKEKENALALITQKGYTFPVYFDTDISAANAYYVSSIPATYFINAEGHLVARASGAINGETLLKGIDMIR